MSNETESDDEHEEVIDKINSPVQKGALNIE